MMRLIGIILGSISLALLPLCPAVARPRPDSVRSQVLVVALNNSLDKGVKPLRFADDDGARYYELFRDLGARVHLLSVLDTDTARVYPAAAGAARIPWVRNLRQTVDQIAREVRRDNAAGKQTQFTFIYVGHGNVDKSGEGYVNLQDIRLRRRDLFRQVIARVPAGVIHLVIDACKSYFLLARGPETWRDDRSGRTYRDEVRAFLAKNSLARFPHVGAILSTSGDEEVHEWSALRSGVFSHQLRSALSGAADINGDGKVEYSEVGAFIAAANYRVTHQRARIRPYIHAPASRRHAPLADLGPATSRRVVLELAAESRGRFSVEDDRGVPQVDLNKAPGAPLRLSLAPRRRYFVRHGAQEAVLPARSPGLVLLAELPLGPARALSRGSVDAAYRADLYALPFSRSFYEGYVATTDLPAVHFGLTADSHLPLGGPSRWRLDLGYGLSDGALPGYGALQHNVALGLTRRLGDLFFVTLRGEFGVSTGSEAGLDYGLYRGALVAGGGLSWAPLRWLALDLELDLGYQALFLREADGEGATRLSSAPAGMKLGSLLRLHLRPWQRTLPRLGVSLWGGFFGYLARVQGRTEYPLIPEGGAGLSYDL